MGKPIYEQAAAIADKLRNISGLRANVTAEDVLRKTAGEKAEIEFYYGKLFSEKEYKNVSKDQHIGV